MDELKILKGKYENGKIDKAEYLRQLNELYEEEAIDDDQYEEAQNYDPDSEDPLIYSQEDVNRIVKARAVREVKKIMRNAGADIDEGEDILEQASNLVEQGLNAGELDADEKELKELRKKAKKADQLTGKVDKLTTENQVLQLASKYKPHNPKQVVRAINTDYSDLLERDEDGKLDPSSVEKAVKRINKAEPNLFKEEDGDEGGNKGGKNKGDDFKGKGPGGSNSNKKDEDYDNKKKEALAAMGFGEE